MGITMWCMGEKTTSDALRRALYHLVIECYGDLETAARELGYPSKTFWRNITLPGPKERTKTISLEFVMDLYAQLRDRFPGRVPEFATFYAAASRFD